LSRAKEEDEDTEQMSLQTLIDNDPQEPGVYGPAALHFTVFFLSEAARYFF
jgi:hypothetical protein